MLYHSAVSDGTLNIAARFERMARLWPRLDAVIHPIRRGRRPELTGYFHTNFRQLLELTDRYAAGLHKLGVTRGTRTILMVRPGPDFFALTFALFKLAAPVVLIDPGMGKLRMVKCLETVQAEAFVGIPLAHWMRRLFPGAFQSVRATVTIKPGSFGRRWLLREMQRLQRGEPAVRTPPFALEDGENTPTQKAQFPIADTSADDVAAILFTTGSTGPPKGVVYTHGVFDAQVRMLESVFGMQHGERDLATFPLFALFDAALGVTAVIPDMDPTRPGFAEPERVLTALRDYRCQSMFASPAVLARLREDSCTHNEVLPHLRRIISAGATVSPIMLTFFCNATLWGDGQVLTPYGATEALPVTNIGHREILEDTYWQTLCGVGTCVGRPVAGMTVRVIHIHDEPIEQWSDDLLVRPGEVGEFAVKGPVVTTEYFNLPEATRLAKIRDADGSIWHRMGDVGWIDDSGRLWFCGRKAHRVVTPRGTLYTDPVETIFNKHNTVRRTALVGVGVRPNQRPVVCVELLTGEEYYIGYHSPCLWLDDVNFSGLRGRAKIVAELKHLGARHDFTRHIDTFLFRRSFPVDIRHNAKIFREKLAVWATRKLGVK